MPATRPIIQVRALLWLLGICCLGVLWLLLSMHSGSSGYRRFISQPLPDGSRYTFLYPAYLKDIQENGQGFSAEITQHVSIYNRQVRHSIWERLGRWMGRPVAEPGENVTVLVIPQQQEVLDNRHCEEQEGSLELRRDEYLTDAHTQTRFLLFYSCPHKAAAQFERNHLAIARSLEVLPPTP